MVASVDLKNISSVLRQAATLPRDKFRAIVGVTLSDLSVADIRRLTPEGLVRSANMLRSVLYGGITVDLPDSRDESLSPGAIPFGPHKISRFFVPAGEGTVGDQVKKYLTEDEFKSLTEKFDLSGALPKLSELAYFWNSHDKARNRRHEVSGDKTTQQEDFDATGYDFGNDRVAVLFCARLVSRARELKLDLSKGPYHWDNSQAEIFNQFSEGEREILKQLRTGVIRTISGALGLDDGGRLSACCLIFGGSKYSRGYAFGSPRSPESKN